MLQRYRETHDFLHVLTGMPVWVEGETAVKVVEYLGLGGRVPMAGVSVLGGVVRMGVGGVGRWMGAVRGYSDPWGELRRFWSVYGPWAVRSGLRMGDGRVGRIGGAEGVRESGGMEEEKGKVERNEHEAENQKAAAAEMGNFLCVYWEEWMDKDVDLLRRHLGIQLPPDMRDMRKRDREERARQLKR